MCVMGDFTDVRHAVLHQGLKQGKQARLTEFDQPEQKKGKLEFVIIHLVIALRCMNNPKISF